MSLPNPLCVGIDVSKATLDIATTSEFAQFTTGNDADGFDAIVAELRKHSVALILMEATGGLEAAVACSLQAEGFDVAVVNPRQARDFARAMGYWQRLTALTPECLLRWLKSLIAIRNGNALFGLCRMANVRCLQPEKPKSGAGCLYTQVADYPERNAQKERRME